MSDEPIIRNNANNTPAVRGTRLTVFSIMDFHLAGDSAERIAEVFGIPTQDARAAMTYIDEHRDALLPRYNEILERNRRGNPPHIEAMFAQSHEKLMRLKAECDRKNAQSASVGAGNARTSG